VSTAKRIVSEMPLPESETGYIGGVRYQIVCERIAPNTYNIDFGDFVRVYLQARTTDKDHRIFAGDGILIHFFDFNELNMYLHS
jgi:hypothetical protein